MNLKSLMLKAICRNGLLHLSVRAASSGAVCSAFSVRILGPVSRGGGRTSLMVKQRSSGPSGPCIQRLSSFGCSPKYSLTDISSPGIRIHFVRTSTTQASPAADVSEGEKPKGNINKAQVLFDELTSLIASSTVTLVDVREPDELQEAGALPGCINIPLTKLKAALALSDEEFTATYSRPKLEKDDPNVVFYGHSSVKSSTAVEIAHKMGFKKSRHYPGGMEEWNQKNPKT